jgi:hypothetical protein
LASRPPTGTPRDSTFPRHPAPVDQHQAGDYFSDWLLLWGIDDPAIFGRRRQAKIIINLSEDHSAVLASLDYVLFVRRAHHPDLGRPLNIHTPPAKRTTYGFVDMLVGMVANLAHSLCS